jgi:ABC-type Fe3+-siderophore transport system permease subunit
MSTLHPSFRILIFLCGLSVLLMAATIIAADAVARTLTPPAALPIGIPEPTGEIADLGSMTVMASRDPA